jgi:hypothetical protein
VERKYSQFVSINLIHGLPPRKLYDNLRRLGVINGPERFSGDVDVKRLSSFFLSLSTGIDFDVPVSTSVPEFSFVSVIEDEVFNAVMSIKSNAAGVDEIPLSFFKSLLPVLSGTLTHVFNHIFTCSKFPARWRASVVLPIPKNAVHVKFSDYRPISLLTCLSKVFEVLMARQMEAHIRRNELLTVFQSRFRRYQSTTAAEGHQRTFDRIWKMDK